MTLSIGITAILVGIIAYGMGKLSVYVQQDNERDPALPDDPALGWGQRQFELWSQAQENAVAWERELAKLISTLSLAGIAGVVALGELKIIGTTGIRVLISGFLLPVFCCVANLQMRQSWFHKRARRIQEALDQGQPAHRLLRDRVGHRIASAMSTIGALLFAIALVSIALIVAAGSTDCAGPIAKYSLEPLYCSVPIQELVHKD
ncbi:hypothetical protein BOTU111921_22930 [Bordetella tumbae]|uniref:hypothetical protein n=1 Tax=Bordetella tumbae TaxID=1649139 RepID=UPI0039F0B4CD